MVSVCTGGLGKEVRVSTSCGHKTLDGIPLPLPLGHLYLEQSRVQ